MGYWNTRGLRGSTLEETINLTNEAYRDKGLALIQKIPTPITAVEVDNRNHIITQAYFERKSTVDYIGAVQGIPICFDAKETNRLSLPVQNIHPHQMAFMEDFERQKGLAFLLVHFSQRDAYFYLPFETLKTYWDAAQGGGRKSIPYDVFDEELRLRSAHGFLIHYLEAVNLVLVRKKM